MLSDCGYIKLLNQAPDDANDIARLLHISDEEKRYIENAESGKRAMRPDSLRKLAAALCVSADYLLTGDIVDKDLLILADKLRQLTPSQIHTIESIIDECIQLYSEQ